MRLPYTTKTNDNATLQWNFLIQIQHNVEQEQSSPADSN